MSFHKKPGVAFWATVVVVAALVAYPLSFGPACWVSQRWGAGTRVLSAVYRPFLTLATDDRTLPEPLFWYARVGARGDDWPIVMGRSLVWRLEFEERVVGRIGHSHGPRDPRPDDPACMIRWVDPVGERVWINVGKQDGVAQGKLFRVRTGRAPRLDEDGQFAHRPEGDVNGRIEVTRVVEDHLSEARILVQDDDCPITKGDLLVE